MPRKRFAIASFKREPEEAPWWDRHRKTLEAKLRRRVQQGKTYTLTEVAEHFKTKELFKLVTIRMRPDDMGTARKLGAQRGIAYRTYIKLLLREALQREAQKRQLLSRGISAVARESISGRANSTAPPHRVRSPTGRRFGGSSRTA